MNLASATPAKPSSRFPSASRNSTRSSHRPWPRCNIQTDSYLGFADDSKPADEQRFGGFDVGRFASDEEIAFIASQKASSVVRPTKLQKHEADITLAARSFHAVVLSLDRKSVALRNAYDQGGKVVYLDDFDASSLSLAEFIKARMRH
jgi:hypothetical protein